MGSDASNVQRLRIYLEREEKFLPQLQTLLARVLVHKSASADLVTEDEKRHLEEALHVLSSIDAQELKLVQEDKVKRYVVVTIDDLQKLQHVMRIVLSKHPPIPPALIDEANRLRALLNRDEDNKFRALAA